MARLLTHPIGIRPMSMTPGAGPQAIGSGSTTSYSGFNQTVASPFGMWEWTFVYPIMRGPEFRRFRGWVRAMHGGVNATRISFCDLDKLRFTEAGVGVDTRTIRCGVPWGNNLSWSNDQNWGVSRPLVEVAADVALGGSRITLNSKHWGAKLDIGDRIGFTPLHLGMYEITEVFIDGSYRIWPTLRKAVTTDDFATLDPVLAMRMRSSADVNISRGPHVAENTSLTLTEVHDYDVRDFFVD